MDSTTNRSDGVLMPPPAPRPPKRRAEAATVLEEEDWVTALEGIIERDFFPELASLKDKVEWMEALRNEDVQKLQAAQLRTGHSSELLDATPPLSLDEFLRSHDSEDNARFKMLLEQANKKRKERARHLLPLSSQTPSHDGRAKTDGFGTSGQPTDTLISWRHKPINMLMYDGSTKESLPLSKKELNNRALLPGPQGQTPSVGGINHRATRFHTVNRTSSASTSTMLYDGVKEGSDPQFSFSSTIDSGVDTDAEVSNDRRRGEYDILATPSFEPGIDVSPFMTWGDIEATPQLIEAEEEKTVPRTFRIQKTPQREQTAHNLAKLAKSKLQSSSNRAQHRSGTPASFAGTPIAISPSPSGVNGSYSERIRHQVAPNKLSEAGKRLVESLRVQRGRKASSNLQLDTSLRASYGARQQGVVSTSETQSEWETEMADKSETRKGVEGDRSWTPVGPR